MKNRITFLLICAVFALSVVTIAQIPQDLPHQSEPVDFTSTKNVLIYIGIPILMIVVYILIRRSRRRKMKGD